MADLIISRKEEGNAVFHIALNPEGSMQPIINAVLSFFDFGLLKKLLRTRRPGGEFYDQDDGTGYFFMYNNNRKRPYPSVMIWKYKIENGVHVLEDVGKEDLRIIPYAVDTYLRKAEKNPSS